MKDRSAQIFFDLSDTIAEGSAKIDEIVLSSIIEVNGNIITGNPQATLPLLMQNLPRESVDLPVYLEHGFVRGRYHPSNGFTVAHQPLKVLTDYLTLDQNFRQDVVNYHGDLDERELAQRQFNSFEGLKRNIAEELDSAYALEPNEFKLTYKPSFPFLLKLAREINTDSNLEERIQRLTNLNQNGRYTTPEAIQLLLSLSPEISTEVRKQMDIYMQPVRNRLLQIRDSHDWARHFIRVNGYFDAAEAILEPVKAVALINIGRPETFIVAGDTETDLLLYLKGLELLEPKNHYFVTPKNSSVSAYLQVHARGHPYARIRYADGVGLPVVEIVDNLIRE